MTTSLMWRTMMVCLLALGPLVPHARAVEPSKIHVLFVGGDWKSQLPNYHGTTPLHRLFMHRKLRKSARVSLNSPSGPAINSCNMPTPNRCTSSTAWRTDPGLRRRGVDRHLVRPAWQGVPYRRLPHAPGRSIPTAHSPAARLSPTPSPSFRSVWR